MGAPLHVEQFVADLVRLRRAQRRAGDDADIAAVRASLEHAIGPTVGRATAARLLGVSQTALDRWIALGDMPAVLTPTDRRELPLLALVDIVDATQAAEAAGARHPLASVLRARRACARQFDLDRVLPRAARSRAASGHRLAELRGLAYHCAVAARLDEQIVRDARAHVQRWRDGSSFDSRYASQWEQILAMPVPRIARCIVEDTQQARDLRQCSPFAGALTEAERARVLKALTR